MKVQRGFYDTQQFIHVVRKIGRLGLSNWRDLRIAFPDLPRLLYRMAQRNGRKRR